MKLKIANQGRCKPDISWKLKITLESFSEIEVRKGGSLPLKMSKWIRVSLIYKGGTAGTYKKPSRPFHGDEKVFCCVY